MEVSVTRRIHIAPQGYEDERIYRPAIRYDADKVILLPHSNNDENEIANRCRERITEELEAEDVETEVERCDIFDLNESLDTLLHLIRSHSPDHDIKVNVAAGSKITAIAGMIACMFTSADPLYVVPEGYNNEDDEEADTVSYGLNEVKGLPAYPIAEPDYQQIQVLDFIHEHQGDTPPEGVMLKEIGEYLLEKDLPAVEGSDKQPGEAEDIYHIVREKVINPLHRRDLIRQQQYKGGFHIRTSSEGEEMLELGRSLINGASDSSQ